MTAGASFGWANRPENAGRRWELVRGVPSELPTWPAECDAVKLRIAALLSDYVIRRHTGEVAFLGDGLITSRNPDTVRCPAVMVFHPPGPRGDFPPRFTTEIPDLVVEVISPSDRPKAVNERVNQYLTRGVPLVWLVYPGDRIVYVHRPDEFTKVLDETDELTGNGLLPDFGCPVRTLFPVPTTG
jgi:Uma2 family endonuclease